jgi:hypothetical protein
MPTEIKNLPLAQAVIYLSEEVDNLRAEIQALKEPLPRIRKPIQITHGDEGENEIFAVCDDGTIWRAILSSKEDFWYKLTPIPQD